jgi:hypothetical protein
MEEASAPSRRQKPVPTYLEENPTRQRVIEHWKGMKQISEITMAGDTECMCLTELQ